MKKEHDFSTAKRGPVIKNAGKTRITIYLDDEIIDEYRKRAERLGRGYQTLINDALSETIAKTSTPVDAKTLRKILREELKKIG